ncbi:MAG: two-component system VirA-like sensor kinase [Parvibaculaceae bacterium]
MTSLRPALLVATGLVIALTYLLIQGMAADAPRHERADALDAIILNSAALQRDVLRARAGSLLSYDPLVRSMTALTSAAARLPAMRDAAAGATAARIEDLIAQVTASVRDEEMLLEDFKSNNALLRNSLSYFNYLSAILARDGDGRRAEVAAEVGASTAAMFRFVQAPRQSSRQDLETSLGRLERLADGPASRDIRSLLAHGRLIVSTLPKVDMAVASLQAAPTGEQTRALQGAYLEAHEQSARRSDMFMLLLYAAALALVAYVAYLFIRLRANARTLSERLESERMIASISTQFINLPREAVGPEISKVLERLVGHMHLDGACVTPAHGIRGGPPGYAHGDSDQELEPFTHAVASLLQDGISDGYQRRNGISIADVGELPESRGKAALLDLGIRSWLCLPLGAAGRSLGHLVFYASDKRPWQNDDVALLRTVGEIFANAIMRESNETARETLQARLNQSQRLEAIGTLAGGIAHEFNNILGAIRGYGEMALNALADPPARHQVRQMMKAGERAQDVIEQILAFGRRSERRRRAIDVAPAIVEAVDLVGVSLPRTLIVRTNLTPQKALIMGDPIELQQVVMNLCTNAAQAMDGRGRLDISLDIVERDAALPLSHGTLPAGRYARLAVADTGHGIDAAVMDRIFEPFFTTKPAGKGTGLGLATVHGIVGSYGGAINVKSRAALGTTFEVYLPSIEGEEDREKEAAEVPAHDGKGETVLIVDDDNSTRLLGEEMLATLGYEPVGFERGNAALDALRADPHRFDAVLTDEVMPELTGTELARAMHEVRPDLPIVLMTGYGGMVPPHKLESAGIREVLRKPLLPRTLAECLARQIGPG